MRNLIVVPVAMMFLGCGGGQTPANDPVPASDPASICVGDDAVKATARPKPPETGCLDKARYAQQSADCNGGDPDACYQIGVCVKLQMLGRENEMPPEEWEQHFLAALASVRVSCDAGIARACLFRAGVLQEELDIHPDRPDKAALQRQMCEDSLRSCKLGDPEGCRNCDFFDCTTTLN